MPDPRPPLRSAQRRFWRVLRDGGSVEHAAVAAGVAVRTGRTWFGKAGGMPPLCLVEPSSSRTLTLQERERIASGLCLGWTATRIAAELGRATSTVTREVKSYMRHRRSRRVGYAGRLHGIDWARDCEYSPSRAQHAAEQRLARPKQARLAGNPRLRGQVQARLIANHSPEQIAARLRQDFPDEPEMWVSHETIYQALYLQARGGLNRELTRHLRTGRTLRKPQRRGDQRRERIKGMVPIAERPPEVADRAVPGHWEGDLIVGKDGKSAIGTLVERTTRFVILLHLPGDHTAITVQEAMIAAMADLPQTLCQTLTWDQGIEMANHAQIAAATDLDIYFCDPHSPWQRGTNENTNGLLRQYFPKGTDLSVWGPGYLATVAAELNNRPRKTLDWKTPAEALDQLLSNPTAHVA